MVTTRVRSAAIENLVSQGVKGILITPNSSSGILAAIKQARDAGVVVIALDTATDPADAVDATFATDNKKAGELAGQVGQGDPRRDKAPKVLMLDGTPGGTVDNFRHDGFLQGHGTDQRRPGDRRHGEHERRPDQGADRDGEPAATRPRRQRRLHDQRAGSRRRLRSAVKAAGKAAQVTIGSIDGSCTGVQNVKAGKIGATVMQFPAKMAQQGVDAVVKFAKDGTKPSGFNNTGSQLITDQPGSGLDSQDTTWGLQNCWG